MSINPVFNKRWLPGIWWLLLLLVFAGPPQPTFAATDPLKGDALVIWLDASDPAANGSVPQPGPLNLWKDKSACQRAAIQRDPEHQPELVKNDGRWAVHFSANRRQWLSITNESSLNLQHLTAFVVARAESYGRDMWLFSKNQWGPPWSGYGLAVSGAGLHPWPHFGLPADQRSLVQFSGGLSEEFHLVEVTFDGSRVRGVIDGVTAGHPTVAGSIVPNETDLTIGTLGEQYLQGDIAELLLYNRALTSAEIDQVNRYLRSRHELSAPAAELRDKELVQDWLFQAEGRPVRERTAEEIRWTRELANRLSKNSSARFEPLLAQLDQVAGELQQSNEQRSTRRAARDLYIEARRIKREIFLRAPAIDFGQLLLIDQPMPRGSEFAHEAVHRMGMMAVPGGRLLVVDGLDPEAPVRTVGPASPGSYWRPELSFDGKRVLFSYKAGGAKSFHLYEAGLDGGGLRQLTDSDYDDIDPIYLPDGHILFTTTRGNTYVRCGPYIYSYTLARCDADGRNIYLVSVNSEPDFVPALLPDGRVIYSRWEYSDKDQNRVQSLWTTRQDGTQTAVYWGNQSIWPDHLAEPRPVPGSTKIMFTAVGHHDWFHGTIGMLDTRQGANFPNGLARVTFDLTWPEVGSSPQDRSESPDYHSSGRFSGYMAPYPLSSEEFLVSARGEGDRFRVYLMDIHGNRELLYAGQHNAWYAIPVRTRQVPPAQPDAVRWPGTGKDRGPSQPGVFFSADVCEGVPGLPRHQVKFLRVIQQEAKTYSTWQKVFQFSGPAVSAVQSEAVKRIITTVPVEPDGSVHFEVPAGLAVYFQLLNADGRAVHTMRSFTGLLPGERRGCAGCHDLHSAAPPNRLGLASRRPPTPITPPPWGDESIGYERFVQPVLDRHCGKCHQGDGEARSKLDLTFRPAGGEFVLFKEPYLTLIGPAAWPVPAPNPGSPGYGLAGAIPVYGLKADDVYPRDPGSDASSTIHRTLRPMRYLSYRSPLIDLVTSGKHHQVKLEGSDLQRLIAWVDANCPFLGREEIDRMPDPDFAGIDQLPIRPALRSAPTIPRP